MICMCHVCVNICQGRVSDRASDGPLNPNHTISTTRRRQARSSRRGPRRRGPRRTATRRRSRCPWSSGTKGRPTSTDSDWRGGLGGGICFGRSDEGERYGGGMVRSSKAINCATDEDERPVCVVGKAGRKKEKDENTRTLDPLFLASVRRCGNQRRDARYLSMNDDGVVDRSVL